MIIAHRGAPKDAPENTIPAFQLAWEQGADGIEGDFHLTADGKVVCIHDRDTRRTSAANLTIAESTLAELKNVDVGALFSDEYRGVTIPTLEEVLDTLPPDKIIHIEIKCGPDIIPHLLDEVNNAKVHKNQIRFICFDTETVKHLKDIAPEYLVFWLCSFSKNVTGKIKPSNQAILETLKDIRADALGASASIPDSLPPLLEENGFDWHVWTVDDLDTAKRMLSLGAKSITTNLPGFVRQHLNE